MSVSRDELAMDRAILRWSQATGEARAACRAIALEAIQNVRIERAIRARARRRNAYAWADDFNMRHGVHHLFNTGATT